MYHDPNDPTPELTVERGEDEDERGDGVSQADLFSGMEPEEIRAFDEFHDLLDQEPNE